MKEVTAHNTAILIRVRPQLKRGFQEACDAAETSMSDQIRRDMKAFVKLHNIAMVHMEKNSSQ